MARLFCWVLGWADLAWEVGSGSLLSNTPSLPSSSQGSNGSGTSNALLPGSARVRGVSSALSSCESRSKRLAEAVCVVKSTVCPCDCCRVKRFLCWERVTLLFVTFCQLPVLTCWFGRAKGEMEPPRGEEAPDEGVTGEGAEKVPSLSLPCLSLAPSSSELNTLAVRGLRLCADVRAVLFWFGGVCELVSLSEELRSLVFALALREWTSTLLESASDVPLSEL